MDSKKLDIVMDVKVDMTVQLGTAELPMKDVVELSPGAQIQLKQSAKDRWVNVRPIKCRCPL